MVVVLLLVLMLLVLLRMGARVLMLVVPDLDMVWGAAPLNLSLQRSRSKSRSSRESAKSSSRLTRRMGCKSPLWITSSRSRYKDHCCNNVRLGLVAWVLTWCCWL
jgi:hypothetical protein